MMKNPVITFEIPATDLERAIAFYASVFGFVVERASVDGNEMAWFPKHDGAPGISSALAQGESYIPSTTGTRVYFSVDDIDVILAKVHPNGGKTLYPRTSVGELDLVAEFEDSVGNQVALHAPPSEMTQP